MSAGASPVLNSHAAELPSAGQRQQSGYTSRTNLKVKVLEFVKSGPPNSVARGSYALHGSFCRKYRGRSQSLVSGPNVDSSRSLAQVLYQNSGSV